MFLPRQMKFFCRNGDSSARTDYIHVGYSSTTLFRHLKLSSQPHSYKVLINIIMTEATTKPTYQRPHVHYSHMQRFTAIERASALQLALTNCIEHT